jgi:hypothetical protein
VGASGNAALRKQPVHNQLTLRANENLPVGHQGNAEFRRHSEGIARVSLAGVGELVRQVAGVIRVENPIRWIIVPHRPDDAISVAIA